MPKRVGTLSVTGTASCFGCTARWSALTLAHCGHCHATFATPDEFTHHRRARGKHGECVSPVTLRTAEGELVLVEIKGVWQYRDDVPGGVPRLDREDPLRHNSEHPEPGDHSTTRLAEGVPTKMATEVTTRLIDDMAKKAGHRVEAAKTVSFGYEGQNYTIDLSTQNAQAFWAALRPYVEAGTAAAARTGGKRKATAPKESGAVAPKATGKPKPDKERTDAIREWARRNSFAIGDRGRIPGEVVDAWEKSGSPDLDTVRALPIPVSAVDSVVPAEEEMPEQASNAEQPQDQPQVDFATSG